MTRKYGTHSPKDTLCAKCGEPIPTGEGRRYRMKWMHEGCLPLTRLAKIDSYRDESARLAASELRVKRLDKEREELEHRFRGVGEKVRKDFRGPKK